MKLKIQNSNIIDGVFIKELVRYPDERGYFEELIRVTDEFFKEGFGQLSHSYMVEGVVKAWHIHKTQVDWWYIASGTLQVALYDNRPESKTYKLINEFVLGQRGDNVVLKIPPGVAHGCTVLSKTSELFYVTSRPYDTNEEGRIDHNDPSIGYQWIGNPRFKEYSK